jgi:hypothetical protein
MEKALRLYELSFEILYTPTEWKGIFIIYKILIDKTTIHISIDDNSRDPSFQDVTIQKQHYNIGTSNYENQYILTMMAIYEILNLKW